MNIADIKERYDYDNPNGDFFYESINCADAGQRAMDFRWLIAEVERLQSTREAMNKQVVRWAKLYNYQRRRRKWALHQLYSCREFACAWKQCADKAEAEVERLQNERKHILASRAAQSDRTTKAEADKAKLTDFINEVKNSADRAYLRGKAEKLILELGEE